MDKQKRYSNYDLIDFLKDERFVKWVRNGDDYSNEFWKNWMDIHPEKTKTILRAKEIIESIQYSKKYKTDQEKFSQLFEDILKSKKTKRFNPYNVLLKVAAVFIIALISYFLIYKIDNDQSIKSDVLTLVKSSQKGEKILFKLPDGSLVKLNAGSTIKYWTSKSDLTRNVYLSGEAFFDVFEDKSRPFSVITNEFTTTALGTKFNIRAYPKDQMHKYSLLSGSVRVESRFDSSEHQISKILSPGQQLVFFKEDRSISYEDFDPKNVISWKNGVLVFKNQKLVEVFQELERWYGVEILIQNQDKKLMNRFFWDF